MEDIERLCKRILIIREGEIVFDGLLDEVKRLYADTKVITAHLHRGDSTPQPTTQLCSYGEIVNFDEGSVVLRVPRSDTAAAAACLLDTYAVADLAIEEMDIGTIIERIMVRRGEGEE
jgi:ABC-2 type transport system ATP-binding protein